MLEFFTGVGVGALIGWNIMPQPTWVKVFYENYLSRR